VRNSKRRRQFLVFKVIVDGISGRVKELINLTQEPNIGNKTLKYIVVACMRKRCSKCEHKTEHLPELCSKNYEGSSKGMEVTGALRKVLHLFKSLDVYVREYVMDDDASTKTILKHACKTLLNACLFDHMVD
jgi:hypothetical protein